MLGTLSLLHPDAVLSPIPRPVLLAVGKTGDRVRGENPVEKGAFQVKSPLTSRSNHKDPAAGIQYMGWWSPGRLRALLLPVKEPLALEALVPKLFWEG